MKGGYTTLQTIEGASESRWPAWSTPPLSPLLPVDARALGAAGLGVGDRVRVVASVGRVVIEPATPESTAKPTAKTAAEERS